MQASNGLQSQFASGGYKTPLTGRANSMNENGGFMHSVAELDRNPDGTMNTRSALEQLKPYFGVPQKQVEAEPYQWWDTESHTLPDAFKGRNVYLLNIIITAILTSEMYPVTEMLPYKKNETSLEIKWDEWIFNDSMLDRTPEESVSRMTTSTTSSNSQHLVRRGKAFMLEHGFWKTPMGQKNWAMNIVQIVNATNETACFGSTHAVLTAVAYVDQNASYNNRRERGMLDVDSLMMEQTDSFARIQKEEGGLATTLRKMDETFRGRNGRQANYVILPSGCDIVLNNRPENKYAIYNGHGPMHPSISSGYPWTTRVSRGYRIGEKSVDIDPHFSTVCIGGFHVMTNQAANLVPIKEYRTQHRTILIFSMSKDDFTPMELPYVFGYLGLYEDYNENAYITKACKISHIGDMFLGKYKTWGKLLDAAGEKNAVLEKLSLLSENQYTIFMNTFDADGVNVVPQALLQAGPVSLPVSFISDDSAQPSVYGRLNHKFGAVDAAVAACIGVPTTNQSYLAFSGNTSMHGISKKSTHIGSASHLYIIASSHFLLYDIRCTSDSAVPKVKTGPKFALVSNVDKINCVKVTISLAVSVLYERIRLFNLKPHKNIDTDAADAYTTFRCWLAATNDFSTLFGEGMSSTLVDLFSSHGLDSIVGYTNMKQFTCQHAVPFLDMINFIILLSTTIESTNAKLTSDFRSLADQHLRKVPPQGVTKGRPDQFADPISSALLYYHHTNMAVNFADLRDRLIQFGKDIKRETETTLLALASKLNASVADQNTHLVGFRSRFASFIPMIGRLFLLVETGTTLKLDKWYINVVILVSKFANRILCAHFLDDVAGITPDKSDAFAELDFINPHNASASKSADVFFADAGLSTAVDKYIALLAARETTKAHMIDPYIESMSLDRAGSIESFKILDHATAKIDVDVYYTTHSARLDGIVTGVDILPSFLTNSIEPVSTSVAMFLADSVLKLSKTVANYASSPEYKKYMRILRVYTYYLCPYTIQNGASLFPDEDIYSSSAASLLMLLMCSNTCQHAVEGYDSQEPVKFRAACRVLATPLFRNTDMWDCSAFCNVDDIIDAVIFTDKKANKFTEWWRSAHTKKSVDSLQPRTTTVQSRLYGDSMSRFLDGIPLWNSTWARYSFENNIPFPIGAIGFRLHKQYDMGTAVMMDAYGQAGFTFFGHADFQLGDDIGKKIHVAHFTLYLKSVVMNSKLIVYARYVISRGYFGGEGTKIYDPLDNDETEDFHAGRIQKDIMYAPVLSNFRAQHNVMDVTGRFPPSMCATADANASIQYESADIMRRVWRFGHSKYATIESGCTQPLHQTIAMQEHTQTYNHHTSGYTDVTLDKGHWGHNQYSECASVKMGNGRCLQQTIFGQTKTMTIGV